MPKSISPAEWKKAVAEQKQRNKQLMEEKAVIAEEAPATESAEAPEVASATDEVEVVVNEPAAEVAEPATEHKVEDITEDPNWTDGVIRSELVTEAIRKNMVATEEAEPKVQEEPVAEEVTTDTAPVVEESISPEFTNESNTLSDSLDMNSVQKFLQDAWNSSSKKNSKSAPSVVHTRIGNNAKKVMPIYQHDFAKFCTNIILGGTMPDTFEITCTILNKSNHVSIWEEGGSYLDDGNVLLVTDAYGNPKEAVTAYHDPTVVCGKHALIGVNLYDHLVLGARHGEKKCIGIYRIDAITPVMPNTPVRAICTQVVLDEPRDEEHDELTISPNLKSYETEWICGTNEGAPDNEASAKLDKILSLAEDTLYNQDAASPIYIRKYNKYYLNDNDYRKVVNDDIYCAKLIKYDSLPELYADFESVSDEYFATHDGRGEDFVGVVNLQLIALKSGKYIIVVYMSGLIYPRVKVSRTDKTSKAKIILPETSPEGRVYYGCTILKEGDTFYYPDETEDTSKAFEHLVNHLKRNICPDGTYSASVLAFKCMC